MINKLIGDISADDILHLIDAGIPESKRLDFKKEPGTNNIDLLKDISALANSEGGDIVFGLAEMKDEQGRNTGIAEAVFDVANADTLCQRINSILQDGVQPRISRVVMRSIPVQNATVLIVRVEKSWIAPHMIISDKHFRFWARSDTGNYMMNVDQLREAFSLGEDVADKLRAFCQKRIDALNESRAFLKLRSGPKIVFHFIPAAGIRSAFKLDVTQNYVKSCGPPDTGSVLTRFNADGHIHVSAVGADGVAASYTQFFRNGIMEYVRPQRLQNDSGGKQFAMLGRIEEEMLAMSRSYFRVVNDAGIPVPYFIVMSLLGFRNTWGMYRSFDVDDRAELNHAVLTLPHIMIESASPNIETELKPLFDILGQAFGYSRSLTYDQNGLRTAEARYQ